MTSDELSLESVFRGHTVEIVVTPFFTDNEIHGNVPCARHEKNKSHERCGRQ